MKRAIPVAVVIVALAAVAAAPWVQAQGGKDPIVAGTKMSFDEVKGYFVKATGQLPENLYGFKATPEVRSFGQIFGHVADTNFAICAAAQGEKPPVQGIEKSKTTKADLMKAVADSFAYCDKAFAGTTDATAGKTVDFFGTPFARLAALSYNTGHCWEHYGNIVTYLRLNKMVPPSSQPSK